jgi:hypothetical protein
MSLKDDLVFGVASLFFICLLFMPLIGIICLAAYGIYNTYIGGPFWATAICIIGILVLGYIIYSVGKAFEHGMDEEENYYGYDMY